MDDDDDDPFEVHLKKQDEDEMYDLEANLDKMGMPFPRRGLNAMKQYKFRAEGGPVQLQTNAFYGPRAHKSPNFLSHTKTTTSLSTTPKPPQPQQPQQQQQCKRSSHLDKILPNQKKSKSDDPSTTTTTTNRG